MKSITVVEDNPVDAKLFRETLSVRGYRVDIVTRGSEALDAVRDTQPNLVLMDIKLPDLDGYEVTRKLKNDPQTKHVPIIAVTAYALKGDREKALQAGCDEYMSKPIHIQELACMVERFIGPADR